MKYEEIIKNKRLTHYADCKDAVIRNILKNIPENHKKKEQDEILNRWL